MAIARKRLDIGIGRGKPPVAPQQIEFTYQSKEKLATEKQREYLYNHMDYLEHIADVDVETLTAYEASALIQEIINTIDEESNYGNW